MISILNYHSTKILDCLKVPIKFKKEVRYFYFRKDKFDVMWRI